MRILDALILPHFLFSFLTLQNQAKFMLDGARSRGIYEERMVGKIRGGSGEGTNKKIRDAFNAPSSPACSWINVARFSP